MRIERLPVAPESRSMPPGRWRALSRIVDEANDLSSAERAAFIARACAGDVRLGEDAQRLLVACDRAAQAEDFLTEPAAAFAAPVLAEFARLADSAEAALPAELTAALSGRYTIERELGRGGMAVVYLAHDLKHGRDVAFKVLRPDLSDAAGSERFLREIATVARLRHPHILPLYDSGEAGGVLYYVMPYVEGESLRTRLTREPRQSLGEALRVAQAVADALDYAHQQGVIHCDIKPENILLDHGHAIVADFGIARAMSAAGRHTNVALGTPAYVSPEQASGERAVDARSDVYSLGCVLYEMLAGQRPFGGARQEISAQHSAPSVTPLHLVRPDVPPEVEQATLRALALAPADRFASAARFAEALSAAATLNRGLRSVPADGLPFIVVLPFENLSANADNEYFSDGITDDIIARLSKISGLKVISRTSAMRYKKSPKAVREIAGELGVSHVLEGSVRRADNRVRITAQLIDAGTDEHVWADAYDRELTDIFAIQSDVALRIAAALRAELSPHERARLGGEDTRDFEAYNLYLKGRQCVFKVTEQWITRGLEYYEKAIARDPHYARAHAGVAFAYVLLGMGHGAGTLKSAEAHAKARVAVDTALALDQGLGDAHGVLGFLMFVADYDWAGAERELGLALELSPSSAEIHGMQGLLLSSLGRLDEAIAAKKRWKELDPLTPVGASDLASELIRAGRYDEAAREAERLIQLDPDYPLGHSALGWAHLKVGRAAEGISELEHAVALSPGNTLLLAQLGQAYGETGKIREARALLWQLEQLSRQRYVSPYHMAYIHTGLREAESAIDWLERASEERAGGVYGIKSSFLFTTLRAHPRFQALLRKMNLT